MADSITQANQRDSPLLRLPTELRNSIYEYVFNGITRVHHCVDEKFRRNNPRTVVEDLTFLRTCKQIRHEATPLFYSISTFQTCCVTDILKLSSTPGCGKILELQIDRFNAYEIASLWQAWEYEIDDVDTCPQQYKRLRRVYVHFPQGCMAYEKHQVEEGIRAKSPHAELEVIVTEDLEDDDTCTG